MSTKLETAIALTASWRDELHAAEVEARTAATTMPATPARAAQLATRRVAARERVTVARDGLEAAHASELAARRDEVAQLAADLEPRIAEAQQAIDAHRQQVADLVAPLEALTGSHWSPTMLIHEPEGVVEIVLPTTSVEDTLRTVLAGLLTDRDALLAAAAGEVPDGPIDQLPAALHPGGLLPDQRLVEAAAEAAQRAAGEERWAAVVAAKQTELDAVTDELGIGRLDALATEFDQNVAEMNAAGWLSHARHAADIGLPGRWLDVARLAGVDAAGRALDGWLAAHPAG